MTVNTAGGIFNAGESMGLDGGSEIGSSIPNFNTKLTKGPGIEDFSTPAEALNRFVNLDKAVLGDAKLSDAMIKPTLGLNASAMSIK